MYLRPSDVMILHLTPEIAEELLTRNYKGNRNKKPKKIKEFEGHIEQGEWNPYVGDLLRITRDGTLIDGQNRCQSVINTGKAIDVLFYDQFEERDFALCDGGTARSRADVVGDIPNKSEVSALVNMVLSTSALGVSHNALNKSKTSNREVMEFIEHYGTERLLEAVYAGASIKRGCEGGSRTVYSWLYVTTQVIDKEKSDYFFEHMSSDLVSIPAISSYRRVLSRSKAVHGKMTAIPTMLHILPIWNAIYEGRTLKQIKMQESPNMLGYWQGCELEYFNRERQDDDQKQTDAA